VSVSRLFGVTKLQSAPDADNLRSATGAESEVVVGLS